MPGSRKKSSSLENRIDRLEKRMEEMKAGLQEVLNMVERIIER